MDSCTVYRPCNSIEIFFRKWEKYFFEFCDTYEDGIGLRKHPYPSTEEIIRIALVTEYMDEVNGASGLLLERELDNVEFREQLLDEIEKRIDEISKERYDIIYDRAELYDVTNRREIVGKHYTEIEADALHYNQMSKKAKTIKRYYFYQRKS